MRPTCEALCGCAETDIQSVAIFLWGGKNAKCSRADEETRGGRLGEPAVDVVVVVTVVTGSQFGSFGSFVPTRHSLRNLPMINDRLAAHSFKQQSFPREQKNPSLRARRRGCCKALSSASSRVQLSMCRESI